MEWDWNSLVLLVFSHVLVVTVFLLSRRRRISGSHRRRFPPGPPGWPVFGNMFDLGDMPHRSLAKMRGQYGGVLWLRFGAVNAMAILSAEASAELFKNHDMSFCDRSVTETGRAHGFHENSISLAPYGPFWRLLRRLMTSEMLTAKRVNETAALRRRCVNDLSFWIDEEARKSHKGVHLARHVSLMAFKLLGNMMFSRDLISGPESEAGSGFYTAMERLMEWGGHANVADVLPWLRWLDPQGLRRKMERDMGEAIEIVSKFVKERIDEKYSVGIVDGSEKKNCKDFLDVLLEFEGNGKDEPAKLSERQLIFFVLEVFLAGSESTSSTIEWAMTELLLHPDAMAKLKAELNQTLGRNRKLEETDIESLPYLNAVVKESMRLHPPIPFLVPRKAINDTDFMGFFVPKGSKVLVNAWAIGRDPDVWENPNSFMPERFLALDSKVDYRGQHFEYIPFGAGRRICAGVPLAHRLLHLLLGSLVQEFEWKLGGEVTGDRVDMRDRLGVVSRKLEPLYAIPTKCM